MNRLSEPDEELLSYSMGQFIKVIESPNFVGHYYNMYHDILFGLFLHGLQWDQKVELHEMIIGRLYNYFNARDSPLRIKVLEINFYDK